MPVVVAGLLLGLLALIAIGIWMSAQPTPASPIAPQGPRERGALQAPHRSPAFA